MPEFTRLNVDFLDTSNVYEGAALARWTDVNSRKHTDEDGEREDEALARRLQEKEWAEQPSAAEVSRGSANKTWVLQSTAVLPVGQSSLEASAPCSRPIAWTAVDTISIL